MLPNPIWFYGQVENVNDPLESGKVQVRVHGVHHRLKSKLPTRFLPWAQVMIPATSTSDGGVGVTPTGLTVGTEVMGIALDDAYTELKVLFTWHGQGSEEHVNDVTPIARSELNKAMENKKNNLTESTGGGTAWSEPSHDYTKTTYPDNDVTITRGGHIIETDNTKGQERIHLYHKSGSYFEMQSSGDTIVRSASSLYSICVKDFNQWIGGNLRSVINGSKTTRTSGHNYSFNGGGTTLISSGGLLISEDKLIELVAPIVQALGDMFVSGTLYVPNIVAGTISCGSITGGSGTMKDIKIESATIQDLDAVAPHALQAGVARGTNPNLVIPPPPQVDGGKAEEVPKITQKQTDNGGSNT